LVDRSVRYRLDYFFEYTIEGLTILLLCLKQAVQKLIE